ncbi:MAG: hypothetical protein U9P14_03285, partial [Gemmatimonadota bacterium]|nr:hypothetical protein [Gemmatimonadota bacterium]
MHRCVLFFIMLFFCLNNSLAAKGSGTAVLLLPQDVGKTKERILTERLAAIRGVEKVVINPATLESAGPALIVAGYGDNSSLARIAEKHKLLLSEFDLNHDGYVFKKEPADGIDVIAAAHSFQGLYYALDELDGTAKTSAATGRLTIEDKIERPALRWRGITVYDNWNAEYMDSVLVWALENRLNRIELKDTDLDDFIFYRKFDRLDRFRRKGDFKEPAWGHASLADERKIRSQRDWLAGYIRKCHDY